jgi:Tfp pilus assembly protein PilN
MPTINLIAEQRQLRRDSERKSRAWFFGFLGVSVVGLTGAAALLLQAESANAESKALAAKILKLRPFKDEIEKNDKAMAQLTPRLVTLTKARIDTQRWFRILDHVSLVLPPDTWITSVKTPPPSDAAKPLEVQWTGMSVDQNLIGELMLRMQRSTDLADVTLKYTDQRKTQQGTGLEFNIICQVPGTEEALEKPKSSTKKESSSS